jgi:hypothetical protein
VRRTSEISGTLRTRPPPVPAGRIRESRALFRSYAERQPDPHPAPASARRKVGLGAVPILIDGEDQAGQAGGAIERKLPGHGIRRPEARDLQEPPGRWVGAVLEVGKDQRIRGHDRLGLADHVPRGSEPCSARCRAGVSRHREHEIPRARDRDLRDLLEKALALLRSPRRRTERLLPPPLPPRAPSPSLSSVPGRS